MNNYVFYFLGGTCGSFVKKLFAYYLLGSNLPVVNTHTGDSHGDYKIDHYHNIELIPKDTKIIAIRYDNDDIDLIIKMEYEKATKPWLEKNWTDAQNEYSSLLPYKSVHDMPYEEWYNIYSMNVNNWVQEQDWDSFELVIELKTILGLNDVDLNKQLADYFGMEPVTEVNASIKEYREIQEKLYHTYYNNPRKLIYAIGDSFTYGQELPDPATQAWPVLLAERLGYRLVNHGTPGVGNEFIVKQTIKAVAKHKPELVVIAWTSCGRQEHADEWGVYDIWPGCNSRVFDQDPVLEYRKEPIKYITINNNAEHEYRRWLRQVVLLQSFLQNHGIEYIMCNAFDNQHRFGKYYKDNQGYYDLIDDTKFVGWPNDGMVEWAHNTPHGSGGHPLEQGHKQIAEKIYEACNTTR